MREEACMECRIGGISNVNGNNLAGLSVSGLVNITGNKAKGVLITGLSNIAGDNMRGLMMSGIMNTQAIKPQVYNWQALPT